MVDSIHFPTRISSSVYILQFFCSFIEYIFSSALMFFSDLVLFFVPPFSLQNNFISDDCSRLLSFCVITQQSIPYVSTGTTRVLYSLSNVSFLVLFLSILYVVPHMYWYLCTVVSCLCHYYIHPKKLKCYTCSEGWLSVTILDLIG